MLGVVTDRDLAIEVLARDLHVATTRIGEVASSSLVAVAATAAVHAAYSCAVDLHQCPPGLDCLYLVTESPMSPLANALIDEAPCRAGRRRGTGPFLTYV